MFDALTKDQQDQIIGDYGWKRSGTVWGYFILKFYSDCKNRHKSMNGSIISNNSQQQHQFGYDFLKKNSKLGDENIFFRVNIDRNSILQDQALQKQHYSEVKLNNAPLDKEEKKKEEEKKQKQKNDLNKIFDRNLKSVKEKMKKRVSDIDSSQLKKGSSSIDFLTSPDNSNKQTFFPSPSF